LRRFRALVAGCALAGALLIVQATPAHANHMICVTQYVNGQPITVCIPVP